MSDARPDDLAFVGRVVSKRFRTLRLVGAGGMGAVYEAEDLFGGPRVALKRLRPEFMQDDEIVRRFVQEGQSAAQIVHPNIVNVLATGQDPEDFSLFIVQEFLAGMDLRQRLIGGKKLAVREAVGIIIPIIDGLAAAHSHGIVHRDIKPANIFLATGPSGEVVPKLIDFGVSKVLGPIGAGLSQTRTGIAVGTPHYMSPEQIRGDKSLDEGSDVWAVGVVLYVMLAGQHPFKAENIPQTLMKILTESARRLDLFVPGVSAQLAVAVANAMQIERARRHPNMLAFLEALLACPLPSDHASSGLTADGRSRDGAPDLNATMFDAGMASPSAPPAYPSRAITDTSGLDPAPSLPEAHTSHQAPGHDAPTAAVSPPQQRISSPGGQRSKHGMRQSVQALRPLESSPAPPPPVARSDARGRWLGVIVVVLFVTVAAMVAVRFHARSTAPAMTAGALPGAVMPGVSTATSAGGPPPTTRITLMPSVVPEVAPGATADAASGL